MDSVVYLSNLKSFLLSVSLVTIYFLLFLPKSGAILVLWLSQSFTITEWDAGGGGYEDGSDRPVIRTRCRRGQGPRSIPHLQCTQPLASISQIWWSERRLEAYALFSAAKLNAKENIKGLGSQLKQENLKANTEELYQCLLSCRGRLF